MQGEPKANEADFTYVVGEDGSVQFTNTSIGEVISFDWDFGDGSPHSTEENPEHTYATGGDKTVTLSIVGVYSDDMIEKIVSISLGPQLIAWYKGEDNLADSVNGNTATEFNGNYGVGYTGKCFMLNYTIPNSAKIKIPYTPLNYIDPNGEAIIEFYVNPPNYGVITIIYSIFIMRGDWYDNFLYVGGNTYANFRSYIQVNLWNFIKITYNAGVWNLYVNNILISPISSSVLKTSQGNTYYEFYGQDRSDINSVLYDEIKIYTDN